MAEGWWAPDPFGRHELRWWDGSVWTSHVVTGGSVSTDPAVQVVDQVKPGTSIGGGRLTSLRKTRYLASHPAVTAQVEGIDIVFTAEGLRFERGSGVLGELPWNRVRSLEADDREGIERRITATRVIFLGGLGFLAKKETLLSYLTVQDDVGIWLFAVPGLPAIELRAGLGRLQKFVPGGEGTVPVTDVGEESPLNVEGRLRRLDDLASKNLISPEEHARKRSEIIGSL